MLSIEFLELLEAGVLKIRFTNLQNIFYKIARIFN